PPERERAPDLGHHGEHLGGHRDPRRDVRRAEQPRERPLELDDRTGEELAVDLPDPAPEVDGTDLRHHHQLGGSERLGAAGGERLVEGEQAEQREVVRLVEARGHGRPDERRGGQQARPGGDAGRHEGAEEHEDGGVAGHEAYPGEALHDEGRAEQEPRPPPRRGHRPPSGASASTSAAWWSELEYIPQRSFTGPVPVTPIAAGERTIAAM